MNRKENKCISLYEKTDIKRAYFSAGLGYLIGGIVGGAKGVIFSLRSTQGKPRGMAYFARQEAQKMANAAALGSISASICRIALEKGLMLTKG